MKAETMGPERRVSIWKASWLLILVAVFRSICFIIWTGCILYATYHVYLAAEEYVWWQSDPVVNRGPLTWILGRGRDATDYEWIMFTQLLVTNLIYWYPIYAIFSWLTYRQVKVKMAGSLLLSLGFLIDLVGLKGTLFFIFQPVSYWLILTNTRSKTVLWTATVSFLCLLNSQWYKDSFVERGRPEYYFVITSAWNYARCVSFCFDCYDRPRAHLSFWHFMDYCFYFPLTTGGPIILYANYEHDVIMQKRVRGKGGDLLKGILRMVVLISFNEIILHCIYFRPLALTVAEWKHFDLWVLGGIVFWLGQFFMLKYKVMYGVPSVIAELDGLRMPPLPKCPSYIHRYSVLWKDFDRGLYYFLVRYTYIPTVQLLEVWDMKTPWISWSTHRELSKLVASFVTFVYVYIWHGIAFEVLVWSLLNFLGITMERAGIFIKQKLDPKQKVHPMIWDFVVEPVVTVPLAAMSILNSSIFCGTLEFASISAQRFWESWSHSYTLPILYCFTHVAVAIRTWTKS